MDGTLIISLDMEIYPIINGENLEAGNTIEKSNGNETKTEDI